MRPKRIYEITDINETNIMFIYWTGSFCDVGLRSAEKYVKLLNL